MTKSIARQLVFFTIAIVSSSIVYSAAPSLLSIEGVNPDGRYNQGDTVNITAKFDDFISTSPNSQMSVTLNVGPETVDVPLTFSATSLVDKSFGVPNTVNAKGKGDASSEGIVMATELKVGANAGRIVVVGSFTEYENSGTGKAKMMVLNADGTIYKTFTSNSSSSFPHVAPQFDARNIQMVFETSEGKILVGGEFTNVWGDTAIDYLVQLNADFTLDTAFMDNLTPGSADSSNGQVGSSGTYGSASYYSANTPVVEQDGKLYIAGDFTQIAGVTTRHIACLNLDGTFCSGFTSPFTGGTRAMSLAIDDNKLWVVGQNMTVSGAGTNVDVWRLNLADGSVDNTYVNRLTGDLVGGIVVLPEIADGGVGGVAISGNSLDMAAHTSSSNGGTAVSTANNKPLFVINDDGTQNTNWSVQGNAFAVNPWSGEGFQIVKDKLFFGMHYAGNDLSADDIRDAAGYYKSLNSTACPSNTANGNNSTSDTCGVSSLMVFNLNDGSINQEFMDIIKAQGSFIKIDSSDDVHDFELLSDGGLLVVGSFSSYRATGAAGDSADDEAMIVKFRFDQLSGSYTVRSPSNDLTGLVKSTGISSYQISNIFDSSNVDTDGNAAYANLVSTNQRFEDNTKYAFNRELANAIELYAEDNSYPVPTVQDYIDEGATGVTAANLDDVNAAIDSLVGADVDTLAEIQSVVNAVNTDSDSDGVNNFFDTCPGTPSGLVVNASGCPAVASAPTVNPTSGNQVSGTAQAGSTVEVKNASGTLLCTTVADSSGNYNCTPLSPVPSNGAVLSVTADNSAGPSAAATATVDSAAPNAPIILVSNAAELSGTAEANSTVTIKDASGAVVATTTAGPDGIYTFNPNPLIDGALGSATSTDAAGNESVPTLFGPVDAAAPTAPSVAVSNAGELSGTAEANSTVTIKDASGAVVATTTAGPDGSYSFTPNPLADGQTGSVTAKDAAGNESPETAITAVDATAPTAPTVAVSNAGELSGTAEANSTVTIKDASGAVVATTTAGPDGSYSFTPNPLADGQTGSVTAKDAAGNESPETAITAVDATAPAAPTVAVSNAGELSGTAEANSTVTIKDASGAVVATTTAGPDGSYSFTPNPLADGQTGLVTAKDTAGNESPATAIGSVDATAPTAPVVTVSNAGELSGTAEANSTVTIKDASGAVVATTTAGPDGSYSFTPNPLADGQTGSVTAKDAAGNESPATAIGSVDSTAPAAPLLNPSTGVEVTGTAEVASTVTITDAGGVVLCTTVAGATGNFSCVLSPVPSEGDTVFATSKDAAGNESIASSIVVGTDTDGDGIPDVIDTDDDNDGLSDTDEINIGTDPLNPDSDNDGVEDGKEVGADTSTPVDSDGDGTIDALDNSNDSDLDGLSNYLETLIGTDPNLRDSDSDDFRDDEELAVKLSGVDSDDDGIDDALDADVLGAPDEDGDGVADFAIRDTDGNGTPDVLDTDSDADGIDDINETLVDGDGDGIADVLDPVNAIGGGDSDGDFIPDAIECCHDSDKDGQPDYMQLDSDSDRINDVDEAGISGVDKDNDGYDDTYDADVDGDGVVDNGPDENADGLNDDWMPLDTDGDGLADYRDTDSDNDGISDEEESGYGSFPNRDTDGDGIPDRVDPVSGVDGGDSDGDGLSDKEECADGYPNCADSDGDGIPDYMDALVDEAPSPAPVVIDTDGDGLSDDEEATLGTDPLKSDTDDDGLSDFVEVTIGSNPIVADTDGDGILDGAENQDINGNGINDTREGYLKTSTKGGALGFIWAGLALLLVRRKHLLAVLAGLLSMVSVASANESESLFSADRVYVGAGLNYSRFSPETAGTGINITDRFDWGYSLSAGYDLFNQWSVNASYEDAGGLAADVLTTKETLDYKALSLLGRWYPTFLDNNERYTDNDRSWHWFVSGGFATVDTSGSLLADEQSSATLAYGIGANYQITESMLVEATVNRYSGDLLSYGLGITWYPFSNGSKKIEPAPEVIPEPEPEVVEVVEPEVVEPVVVEPVVEIQPCTSKSSRADILFDTNSSKLKSDFFDILDRAVVDYFACEESVITLVGFTDSSGSVRYNEKLSYKRADTVRTYLQERGIPSDHIVTISRGIDPSSGLPENEKRRVELYFGSY